jgi:uncharacterized protein (TIGR03085 family)
MSTAPWSVRERLALCDLFESLGPDAPTLCEGWATVDLAAHLVVRERDVFAAPGIVVGGAARRLTERAMERYHQRGFHWLVDTVRSGPPLRWRLPGLGERLNLIEFFVHHEDVRRAQPDWQPRELPAALQGKLWASLKRTARLMFRKSATGIVLIGEGHGRYAAKLPDHHGTVVLRGTPAELVLYAYGRKAVARVELGGDADDIAALQEAELGLG